MDTYEQENKKVVHIIVVLCYTIFSVSMIGNSMSRGGESFAVVLLVFGLAACWIIYITEPLSELARLWIYTIVLMLSFFFYGSHEQSVFDAAPVMLAFLFVYTTTEEPGLVRACAVTYYLTMCYDFIFVPTGSQELFSYPPVRVAVHFLVVFLGERVSEMIIQQIRTERENTEDTISRLKAANQSAEDFLANVSHELRTPINAVTGITASMLRSEDDPSKRENLLSIEMAGNRLFNQIEDILDYSEIDTGRIQVSEETYSITSLVNDVMTETRIRKRQLDTELIFDIDSRIPSVLIGDGRKIKKVLKHLMDNSIKFTNKGGIHIRIYALPKPYGINLCIRISDTGIGISDEELKKIPEKFFQASGGRARKTGGLGLGLPIAYGMVSAMGGFVQLESTEGAGTAVSVSIPQKVADASHCMEVTRWAGLTGMAVYLRSEKYEIPEIRDYYNMTISHMVQELDLTVHRVSQLEELMRLVSSAELSHVFVGDSEYEENAPYFEQLGNSVKVVVIAGENFRPAENSRIKIVRKPFYNLPIINILNSKNPLEDDAAGKEILACPGVRVLVVDDEPMNLMVAKDLFESWDMEVRSAESGKKAIEICEESEFDLIFLDHMMPEMDGVETLRALRRIWANTGRDPVVIAFSANAVSGAREMFLREGFDEFIAKPIMNRDMMRLLRKVLPASSIVYAAEKDEEGQSGDDGAGPAGEGLRYLEERGFRTEDGLHYCNNDSSFYQEVLMRFAQDAEHKAERIEDAFRQGDLKNYRILVHALKSSSKMVGAEALSGMAKNSEKAAKNQDAGYVNEHHKALMDQYREAARHIHEALCPAAEAEEAAEPEAGTGISETELLRYLSELKAAIDTYEMDKAENLFTEMSEFSYRGTSVPELLREVRQDLDDFEWDSALHKLEALYSSLEGGEAL